MGRTPTEFARIAGEISGYTGKYALEIARGAGISLDASEKEIREFFSKHMERRERLHGGSKLMAEVNGTRRSRDSWARHLSICASTLKHRSNSFHRRNPHMSREDAIAAVVSAILAKHAFPRRGARPGQRMKPIPKHTVHGVMRGVDEWAKICGVNEVALRHRIRRYESLGKAPEDAISMYLRRVGIAA
jgi:hypothetical protein